MKRWLWNWFTSRTPGTDWFYLSKIEWVLPTNDQMGPRVRVTYYYAACNTSARPHWYEERRRADTVHKTDIKALLKDLKGENVWVWTKEEFDAKTQELIADAVFKDIE